MRILGVRTITERAATSVLTLLVAISAALGAAIALPGCTDAPAGTPVYPEEDATKVRVPTAMRVVSSFGGAHRALVVEDGVWFQAFANRVLLLECETGTVISDVELAPRGTTGPAVDLAVRSGSLFVVLERDEVIELDIRQPRAPKLLARWGVAELGIEPMKLSVAAGELWVSGDGGLVRLVDAAAKGTTFDKKGRPQAPPLPERLLEGKLVGTVVDAEGGPVACVGRRILRVSSGEYLGAASMLVPIPAELGGGYAFALQATEGAGVGIMGADFRERSSSALRGTIRAIRIVEKRFVAITDTEATTWKFEPTPGIDAVAHADGMQLGTSVRIAVKGARDVARVRDNRFAVAGSFGRAIYRFMPEGDQPGDTFFWSERMPGRLDVCVSDRRRVLAAGVEGAWMYLIGEKAELVERQIPSPDPQSPRAEVAWGVATCDEAREVVSFRVGERALSYKPSRAGLVSTLASADGKVWVGHDNGIDVVGIDPKSADLVCESRIVLAGPIIAIYPNRVGGGVNYVARLDGFGVIRPIAIDAPPTVTPGTVSAFAVREPAKQGEQKP